MSDNSNLYPNPEDIQKLWEKWKTLVVSIGSTAAGVLTLVGIPGPAAQVGGGGVAVLGLGATVYFLRKQQRRKLPQPSPPPSVTPAARQGPAFRDLARFMKGSRLPGVQRRLRAEQLRQLVLEPERRIIVVAGDSGAGKSSLLDAGLQVELERHNAFPIMFANVARTFSESIDEGGADRIKQLIRKIRDRIIESVPEIVENEIVVILDQFEELLFRVTDEADRKRLGREIWKLTSIPARLVIGTRKEHLAALQSVSREFGYSISLNDDIFIVENFDIKEAAQVIVECARHDESNIEDELAETIAEDLSEGGRVRPADLQIVCTALNGDLTLEKYLQEGRSAGLRSKFIKSKIEISGDPVLARNLLRQLCDFLNNRKTDPKSSAELCESARNAAPGPQTTTAAVENVLTNLDSAKVVVRVESRSQNRWTLIHDVLAVPIRLATEEQDAQASVASGRLEYYLNQINQDSKVSIPLRELKSIRRYAPPVLLQNPAIRRLIRRSFIIGYGIPAITTISASIMVASFILFLATEHIWNLTENSEFTNFTYTSDTGIHFYWPTAMTLGEEKILFEKNAYGKAQAPASVWDLHTGALLSEKVGVFYQTDNELWLFDNVKDDIAKVDKYLKKIPDSVINLNTEIPHDKVILGIYKDGRYLVLNTAGDERYLVDILSKNTKQIEPPSVPETDNFSRILQISSRAGDYIIYLIVYGNGISRRTVLRMLRNNSDVISQTTLGIDLGNIDPGNIHIASYLGTKEVKVYIFAQNSMRLYKIGITDASTAKPPIAQLGSISSSNAEFSYTNISSCVDDNPNSAHLLDFDFEKLTFLPESRLTNCIIWPLDKENEKILAPIVNERSVAITISGNTAGLISNIQNTSPKAKIWLPRSTLLTPNLKNRDEFASYIVDNLNIGQGEKINLTRDATTALIWQQNGKSEMVKIDLGLGTASTRRRLDAKLDGNIDFSSDELAILLRHSDGKTDIYDLNGTHLGQMEAIGGSVMYSQYFPECQRLREWTNEGLMVEFQHGFKVPLFGFYPETDCNGHDLSAKSIISRALSSIVSRVPTFRR